MHFPGDQHGQRAPQVPAEPDRPLQRLVHVARRAGDQVVQRVRGELLLDREHGQVTGDLQRGDQRRLLDRDPGRPGQALRAADGEHPAVPHLAGPDDRGRPGRAGLGVLVHARDQPAAGHPAAPLPGVQSPDVRGLGGGARGGGQRVAGRVADHHVGAGQDLGQLAGQPGQAAAGQRDAQERVVDLLPAGQRGRLPVDDRLEGLAQHVVQRRRGRDDHDREGGPVGQLDRVGGHLGEVLVQLDAEPGQPLGGQLLDQPAELSGLAGQRVSGGEQELVLLGPADDVRHGHDVEPADHAVQAVGAGDDPGPAHGVLAEHLADGQPVDRDLPAAPAASGQRDDAGPSAVPGHGLPLRIASGAGSGGSSARTRA